MMVGKLRASRKKSQKVSTFDIEDAKRRIKTEQTEELRREDHSGRQFERKTMYFNTYCPELKTEIDFLQCQYNKAVDEIYSAVKKQIHVFAQ